MARGRGLPKAGNARLAKWQAKYDPTVVQTRFTEVQQCCSIQGTGRYSKRS